MALCAGSEIRVLVRREHCTDEREQNSSGTVGNVKGMVGIREDREVGCGYSFGFGNGRGKVESITSSGRRAKVFRVRRSLTRRFGRTIHQVLDTRCDVLRETKRGHGVPPVGVPTISSRESVSGQTAGDSKRSVRAVVHEDGRRRRCTTEQ